MTVHILDTGAVYLLTKYNQKARKLREELRAAEARLLPEIVMVEVDQAAPLGAKSWEAILALAEVVQVPAPRAVATRAAEALRALKRGTCKECGALLRPTLVDAWIVAFAERYAESDEVIVHTSDVGDLTALRDALGCKFEISAA